MKEYTLLSIISVIGIIIFDIKSKVKILSRKEYYVFLIIIYFFKFIVNGYLTGKGIVLYNNRFFLGIRLGSIPLEDFLFGFSMITLTIILWEYFKKGKVFSGGKNSGGRIAMVGLIIFAASWANNSYALDWKILHEEADKRGLKQAELIVKESPQSIDDLYVLGLIYLGLHEIEKAKDIFSRILELNSQVTEAKWAIAEVFRCQHNFEKSEEILSRIVRANPDFAPASISYAYIRYAQTKYQDVLKFANNVASKDLDHIDLGSYVRANLLVGGAKGMIAHFGGPLVKIRHGLGAFSYLRKAESLSPDSAQVYFGVGAFYLLAPAAIGGDLNKALDYLMKAVDKDPLLADAYVRLAQVYGRKGDKNNYRKYLDKALEIDPKNELARDIKNGKCNFICFP